MNGRRRNRLLFWTGLGVITLAAFAIAFWPRGIAVDVATMERGPMMVTLDEEGETRVHDVYTISAPLAGEITRVNVEPGDAVIAGSTVIATIYPVNPSLLDVRTQSEREAQVRSAEAAVKAAEADVASASSQLDFANAEARRARELAPKGNISAQERERIESNLKVRKAALEAAKSALAARRSELDAAKASLITPQKKRPDGLDPVDITSPIDGQVLRILRKSEGVVAASEPLVDIGDPNKLEAVTDYLSTDAVQIHPGDKVLIDDWGGSVELQGHVQRIEPFGFTKVSALGIEEQRVNVIIDFDSPFKARARLGHGYRIESRVVIWQSKNVLKVPLGCVFREGDKWSVFLIQDGRARLKDIEIGHRNTTEAEVLSGLKPGDVLILHPSDKIRDGVRVSKREKG